MNIYNCNSLSLSLSALLLSHLFSRYAFFTQFLAPLAAAFTALMNEFRTPLFPICTAAIVVPPATSRYPSIDLDVFLFQNHLCCTHNGLRANFVETSLGNPHNTPPSLIASMTCRYTLVPTHSLRLPSTTSLHHNAHSNRLHQLQRQIRLFVSHELPLAYRRRARATQHGVFGITSPLECSLDALHVSKVTPAQMEITILSLVNSFVTSFTTAAAVYGFTAIKSRPSFSPVRSYLCTRRAERGEQVQTRLPRVRAVDVLPRDDPSGGESSS